MLMDPLSPAADRSITSLPPVRSPYAPATSPTMLSERPPIRAPAEAVNVSWPPVTLDPNSAVTTSPTMPAPPPSSIVNVSSAPWAVPRTVRKSPTSVPSKPKPVSSPLAVNVSAAPTFVSPASTNSPSPAISRKGNRPANGSYALTTLISSLCAIKALKNVLASPEVSSAAIGWNEE